MADAPAKRPPQMNGGGPVLSPEDEYVRRLKKFPQAIEHLYFG